MADPLLDVQKLPDDVKIRLAELELELSEGKPPTLSCLNITLYSITEKTSLTAGLFCRLSTQFVSSHLFPFE